MRFMEHYIRQEEFNRILETARAALQKQQENNS